MDEGSHQIILTFTPGGKLSTTLSLEQGTLADFEELLVYRVGGKDGPAIIPAILENCPAQCRGTGKKDCGGNHAHRLNANVTHVTALALDCDNLSEKKYNELIDAIETSNLYAFVWQSFSCKAPDDYRCRVLIPFQDPLPIANADDWSLRMWPALVASLGPGVSSIASIQPCKDPARLYFLPAKSREELVREATVFPGVVWDPTKVVAGAKRVENAKPTVQAPEQDESRPVDLGAIRDRLARIDTPARDVCQALLLGKALTPPPGKRQPYQPTRYEAWRTATSALSLVLEGWESSKAAVEILRPSFAAMTSESPDDYTAWDVIEDLLETARASAAQYKAERQAARENAIEAMKEGLAKRLVTEPPAEAADATPDPTAGAGGPPSESKSPSERLDSFALTDLGNAERLWDYCGAHYRFVADINKWFAWDGKRWTAQTRKTIAACQHESTRELAALAQSDKIQDEDFKGMVLKHALKGESASATRATIQQAQEIPQFRSMLAQYDTDQFVLNVENGTIDLVTGQIAPHDSKKLITKIAPVNYNPEATAPQFERFIAEVLPDADTRAFVQRVLGYCLTGSTREQALFFAYGAGQNGKSTLVKLVQRILGDFQQTGAPGMLVDSHSDQHPTAEARLQGARFVTNSETEQNSHFSEAKIKRLTGGDIISARFMGDDFFDFTPSHKFFLTGNKKPRISGTDNGIWRRINIIPFTVTIVERDDLLDDKLWAEREGVLNWLVQGCLMWQRDGLCPSQEVLDANDEYRKDEDTLAEFLVERCSQEPGETKLADLYLTHCQWLAPSQSKPWQRKAFAAALRERGFSSRHTNAGVVFGGIKVRTNGGIGAGTYGQIREQQRGTQ